MRSSRATGSQRLHRGGLTAVLLVLLALPSYGQVGRSGLVGTAVDENGKPMAGLEIIFQPAGETAGRTQTIKTDGRGRFANRFLTTGQYVLDVKDGERFYIQSANVDVKDAGGVLLNQYEIINHPKTGLTPLPVRGGQITEVRLLITAAAVRDRLIRQIEGGAVSNEVSQMVTLLNAGQVEEAAALGQKLMDATTTEIPELIHLVGVTYARLHRNAEAEPLLRRAVELEPDQAEFTASLGTMLLEVARQKHRAEQDATKEYAEAEVWLGKAVAAMQPPPVALLTNHSIALEGAGRTDAALEIMDRIARQDPNNIVVRLRMAALLRKNGQAERALEVLNTLPGGGDPRAVDSLFNVALDFYNAEDYESSLAALLRAQELQADHAMVQRLLGRVYYVAADYPKAVAHLRRFLALQPDHPEAKMDRELVTYLEQTMKKKK